MRGHEELMERLAAADPVRDREPLTPEDQREADALLARLLATPAEPAAAPRRLRSHLRRRALAVAGAACAALAVFVAIDLVGSKAPGPGVVDRAVAAMTRGGRLPRRRGHDLPRRGRPRPQAFSFESWYTPDGRLHRKTFHGARRQEGPPARGLRRTAPTPRSRERIGASVGRILEHDRRERIRRRRRLAYLGPFEDPARGCARSGKKGRLRAAGTTTVGREARLPAGLRQGRRGQGSRWRSRSRWTRRPTCPLTQRLTLKTAAGPKSGP